MAVVNTNKPESFKIRITITLLVKDEFTGNREAAIILHVAYLISQPIGTYNHTSPNLS